MLGVANNQYSLEDNPDIEDARKIKFLEE